MGGTYEAPTQNDLVRQEIGNINIPASQGSTSSASSRSLLFDRATRGASIEEIVRIDGGLLLPLPEHQVVNL